MDDAGGRPWAVVLSSDLVGLGAVRSLHAGGVPTLVVMLDPLEPVRVSRYAHKILVPKSHDVEGALLNVLAEINRGPRPVLIPTSDHLVHFMAKHRAHLEVHFRCCIPPNAAVDIALDKAKDTQLLQGTQVPLPKTVQMLPASPAELIRQLGLPLIVKPRTHVDKEGLGWRNVIIRSAADADVKYDARDRRYKYLELNPRLGMCHYFGTCCGKNVTLDAYRLACGDDLPEDAPQVEGRTFLAVLEEIGGRLQDGDSLLAVLRGLLVGLVRRPVGAYFAPDDVWPGPFAVFRISYRLLARAWRGQLGAVFTKQLNPSA